MLPNRSLFRKHFRKKTRAVINGLCSTTGLFCRKVKTVGKWLVTGEEVGAETGFFCLVPSAKLHLQMLPETSLQEML